MHFQADKNDVNVPQPYFTDITAKSFCTYIPQNIESPSTHAIQFYLKLKSKLYICEALCLISQQNEHQSKALICGFFPQYNFYT